MISSWNSAQAIWFRTFNLQVTFCLSVQRFVYFSFENLKVTDEIIANLESELEGMQEIEKWRRMKSCQLWKTFLRIFITIHLKLWSWHKNSGKRIRSLDSVVFSTAQILQNGSRKKACKDLTREMIEQQVLTKFKRLKQFLKFPFLKCIFDEVLFSKHGLKLIFTSLSLLAFWILQTEIGTNWRYSKKQYRQSFAVPLKKDFRLTHFQPVFHIIPIESIRDIEVELWLKMG